MNSSLDRVAAISDLRLLAARRLPRPVFDFLDGGAGSELTCRDNEAAFTRCRLLPRIGVDVSRRVLETRALGQVSRLPFGLSPIGFSGLLHPHGEILAAKAAARAGIPFCLSTLSVASMEDIARVIPDGDKWFQLYFLKDRELLDSFLTRAAASDFRVLCVTVDLAEVGRRDRDVRNAFTLPLKPSLSGAWQLMSHLPWTLGALRAPVKFGNFQGYGDASDLGSLAKHINTLFNPGANWEEIARLRDRWKGPMLLKGILHPEDAERAAALGCEAISVSNHGGRQLDGVPSALDALAAIRPAAGKMELLLDGGIRRGGDIVKAKAMGASFVLIGRAYGYGLSAAGSAGVDKAIGVLEADLDNALALLGVPSFADICEDHLTPGRMYN